MKILMVIRNSAVFRHFGDVVRQLDLDGHQVDLHFERSTKPNLTDRNFDACLADISKGEAGPVYNTVGKWAWLLRRTRLFRNYAIYSNPSHPSPALEVRFANLFPQALRKISRFPIINALLTSKIVLGTLRLIEQIGPPDRKLVQLLSDKNVDIVVASPFIYGSLVDVDYVKAAKSLNIPTIVPVASWDNLTTKGTFQIIPDQILVWNQDMYDEIIDFHGISGNQVRITGSPGLDAWFELKPSVEKRSFCEKIGLDSTTPYVVYTCSSANIAGDETSFVLEFVRCLRENPITQEINILVRPHPLNSKIWNNIKAKDFLLWPRTGEFPDTSETRQEYFDALYFSEAVVGVNTSAMLEATIINKPCVTIFTEHYWRSQHGMGHFHHLLKADFLECANGIPEAANILERIIRGEDSKAENRQKFVHNFIRPLGMDKVVSVIMANLIEKIGTKP